MPVKDYYKGSGRKVMRSMKEQYGAEKGERVFYAVANAQKQAPKKRMRGGPPKTGYRRMP